MPNRDATLLSMGYQQYLDIEVPKTTSRLDYYYHWTEKVIYQINEDDVTKKCPVRKTFISLSRSLKSPGGWSLQN